MLRISAIIIACALLFGVTGCSDDKVEFKSADVVHSVQDTADDIIRSIRDLGMSKVAVTNAHEIIKSCGTVVREKGSERSIVWNKHLYSRLRVSVREKIMVRSYAASISVLIAPSFRYFDDLEKAHPDWDMTVVEQAFFDRF